MPQDLADFLDELGSYIEREIARLPAPLAEALSRPGNALPTQELLHLLNHPEEASRFLKNASGTPSAAAQ